MGTHRKPRRDANALRARRAIAIATATLCAGLSITACSSGDPASPRGATITSPDTSVTYHAHIRPILERVCQRCHVANGIGPIPLTTFIEAKNLAYALMIVTADRKMPPWGAATTPECPSLLPWQDDTRLSEEEIALFKTWYDTGAIEGNPGAHTQSVAAPGSPPTFALETGVSVSPRAPYIPTSPRDAVQCFLVDPLLEGNDTKYLRAAFFLPQNKALVHHALAYAIPKTAGPETMVDGKTPVDAMEPYECFGGPRIEAARFVTAWASGMKPMKFPAGAAMPIAGGTRFLIQVHYHSHHGTLDPDRTTLQVDITNDKPLFLAEPRLVGDFATPMPAVVPADIGGGGLLAGPNDPPSGPVFFIPKETKAHTETMRFVFGSRDEGTRIGSVSAQMHFAGTDEKVSLVRGAGSSASGSSVSSSTCLLQDPSWQFDWMRSYAFDAPAEGLPIVHAGDALEMRCTYDTTKDNWRLFGAFYESGLGASPRDIVLGGSPTDESCAASVVLLRSASR